MIEVKQVLTRRQQREFLDFPLDLYAGNPNVVPPLEMDERKMFRKDYIYNDCCRSVFYLAYRDGSVAGRIQGIIQEAANAKNGQRRARFCRFDAVDDQEVSKALFAAVEKWALEQGMDTLCGPLGYSDLEREGLLVAGFDQQATFEENYNAEYYQRHIEALGFTKEVDWLGFRLYGPEGPETLQELDDLTRFIFKRYKLHFGPSSGTADFLKRYADGIFALLDTSYENLYGTVPFTEGMKKLMMDNFRLIISPKYTAVILDENERVVCFGVAFPALSHALVGTRGRLTPRMLLRLLGCLRRPTGLDLGLVGVDPEYLNRGVSAVFSAAIMRMLEDPRVEYADTNLNLEDNWAILNQWKRFRKEELKRYRAYVKKLKV